MNKLANIPFKLRLLAEIFILAILIGAYVYFMYMPNDETLQAQFDEYDRTVREINTLLPYQKSKPLFEKQLSMLQEQYDTVLKVLPNEKSYYLLYDEVVGLAEKTKIKVVLFQPAGEVKIDDFHSMLKFNMTMEGTFFGLVRFLYDINYLDKIVNLNSMRTVARSSSDGNEYLAMNLTLLSYRFQGAK